MMNKYSHYSFNTHEHFDQAGPFEKYKEGSCRKYPESTSNTIYILEIGENTLLFLTAREQQAAEFLADSLFQ